MLEYCKTILEKVSFDRSLLEKEYYKSLSYLKKTEQSKFIEWCQKNFQLTPSCIPV